MYCYNWSWLTFAGLSIALCFDSVHCAEEEGQCGKLLPRWTSHAMVCGENYFLASLWPGPIFAKAYTKLRLKLRPHSNFTFAELIYRTFFQYSTFVNIIVWLLVKVKVKVKSNSAFIMLNSWAWCRWLNNVCLLTKNKPWLRILVLWMAVTILYGKFKF